MSSDPIELTITETTEAELGFVIDAGSDADAQRFVPVALILERAFARHDAHRVWLDVITWNERAQRAYAAAGFVREGVRREVLYMNGRFEWLVVMSVLRAEWEPLRTR